MTTTSLGSLAVTSSVMTLMRQESRATVNQFLEWFPEVKEWEVAAVLNHEAEHLKALART